MNVAINSIFWGVILSLSHDIGVVEKTSEKNFEISTAANEYFETF